MTFTLQRALSVSALFKVIVTWQIQCVEKGDLFCLRTQLSIGGQSMAAQPCVLKKNTKCRWFLTCSSPETESETGRRRGQLSPRTWFLWATFSCCSFPTKSSQYFPNSTLSWKWGLWCLSLWVTLFSFLLRSLTYVCMCTHMCHDERGGSFLLSPCGLLGLNSSHQAWHQDNPASPR